MTNPPPSTPFVPPSRTEWDILFQPLFNELLNPLSSVDRPALEVIAPIAEVVAPELVASTGSPFSTIAILISLLRLYPSDSSKSSSNCNLAALTFVPSALSSSNSKNHLEVF
ncbi:hypothetical protein Tco_1012399 [Tanacetum coccineum]